MIDTINWDDEARLCWIELRQRVKFTTETGDSDRTLENDAIHMLQAYMKEGLAYMSNNSGGYSPVEHAPYVGKRAIREYAKAIYLGGDPASSPTFLRAFKAWSRQAAIDNSRPK